MNLYTNIELLAKNLKNGLEEKTSLKISYKSLSPSILSSLYIREIKLETEEGDKIASIDKIKLDYRLFSILKGDFDKGFKLVSANGVTVDVSSVVKVYSILGLENKEPVTKEKKVLDLSSFKATLPVNIILKDVSLVYKDEKVRASVICNKISANANSRSDQINLDMNAILKAVTKKGSYSSGFKLSGSLYDGFENSNANISLSELTDGNLTLNRLNFLLGYKNNVVSAATIRNTFPLVINAEYNTANMTSKAVVRANDLTLAKVFKVSKQNDILKRAGEIRLSSLTNMSFSFEDKALCYDSETSVLFPENLVPGGLKTSLVLDGTDKKMNIRKISADGLNYEASGSLDVVFQTLGVSGAVDITKVVLPNGNEISSSIYFDPLKKGFMAFAPQLFIGESALTALQLSLSPSNDSFDFSFEVYDYSHIDSDIPGKIQIDGSYLLSSKYIQSSAAVNSFYLDSGLKISSNFLNQGVKENISGLTHTAEDFMFSADAYFTTDLKSLSFNVPYILIANTKKDNQALMLSFDGNEQSVNLSQADLIYGKQALHASASLDTLPGSNDLFFVSEIIYNSIPYRYSGTFTDNVVSVSGDYSTEVRLDFSKLPVISGNVEFENFPIPVMDTSFIFSLDSGFVFNANNDFSIVVNKFETEEAGNYLGFRPHLSANGNVNRYGARFNTISYSDIFSSLDGSADFVLNLMDDVFSSAAFSLNMQNSRSDENVSVDMNVSNPEMLPFGLNALKNDF